jgi:hypothetical protein
MKKFLHIEQICMNLSSPQFSIMLSACQGTERTTFPRTTMLARAGSAYVFVRESVVVCFVYIVWVCK